MFYFLHITKCAGTSFISLARKNISLFRPGANGNPLNPLTSNRLQFWTWRTEEQRYLLFSDLCELIANENQLGEHHQFFEGVTYITILRDPLDRLFSEYQFRSRSEQKGVPLEVRGRRFAAFLEREGVRWRRNTLVTALTHRGGSPAERLELAKQRLVDFDHIFLTHTLSEDMKTLARYGWHHLDVPWKNTPAGAENASGWSIAREALRDYPKLLEQLTSEHEIDLELYAFAKTLVGSRSSGAPKPRRMPLSDREMPGGDNFEFLLFCAYEAFLKNDRPGCLALLHRAGRLPSAAEIFDGPSEHFVEYTLERFGAPKRVERERRQKRRRKSSAAAETSA